MEDGDKRLLPEAYYYAGRVYRDLGDAPRHSTISSRRCR